MAAHRQQGTYVALFITAFTAIPVGLLGLVYQRMFVGVVVTIGGFALLAYSLFKLRRIKPMEFTK